MESLSADCGAVVRGEEEEEEEERGGEGEERGGEGGVCVGLGRKTSETQLRDIEAGEERRIVFTR